MFNSNDLRIKQWASLALLWLSLAITLRAETVQAFVSLNPANEIPPITNLEAQGAMSVTIEITRDNAGAITNAKMSFLGTVQFPGNVTIQGLHIHEGDARTNGNVRFDTGLSSSNTLVFSSGIGLVTRDVTTVDLTVLRRLLENPAGFYVNLHTSVHPGGAIRGQLTRLHETLARTITLSPANEVPPITDLNASGTATVTLNPMRNAQGAVTGGAVTFTVSYDFPGTTVIRGLHIHEGAAGVNAGVVIDTGLSASNTINATTGKGIYSQTVYITDATRIAVLARLLANPSGFYVNLHTSTYPGGAIRGQLEGNLSLPPIIAAANPLVVTTGTGPTAINITPVNFDLTSQPLVNGQLASYSFDFSSAQVAVQIPVELRANPGLVTLQIRAGNGTLSTPRFIPVATATTNAAVVDAAGYGSSVSAESIAALFGTNLATQAVATGAVVSNSLDGTSVYVNGVPAPLFFVSPGQINFYVPETSFGPTFIVIRNREGGVALTLLINISHVAPGVFTRLANGRGAPAAVASNDNGQTYTIAMSNNDGTPVELQVGNIAVLFGTGLRFRSSSEARATAGGVDLTPATGAQGSLLGLDQINLIIPESLRGKGEMDLVFNIDGKTGNAVRIKVR